MKNLIIEAVMNFIGVMCFFALSCLIAFISFNSLLSPAPTAVKSLAVFMLMVSVVIFLAACVECLSSYEDWTENYKLYKKWND
jgi:uncharacterized membrane protein